MKILTAEEFKKRYGQEGIDRFAQAPKEESAFGQRMADQFKQGLSYTKQGFVDAGQGKNPISSGLKIGEGLIQSAFSPVTAAVQPAVEPTIGKAVNYTADKISNVPVVQKFANTGAGQFVANRAEDVKNFADIAVTIGGGMEAPKVTSGFANAIEDTAANVTNKSKTAFNAVKENAVAYPRQIADKITMGKIEPRVQTILKETPASKFDEYVKVGQEAMTDPRKLTPLELAGSKANDMVKTIKATMDDIGQRKSQALESVGGARVKGIATKQVEKIKPLLQKKLTDSERSLVNQYLTELQSLGEKPTARSVDATIDKLQATLYEKKGGVAVPTTPRIQAFINKSIGELNSDLKKVVDKAIGDTRYSDLNLKYARQINTFNKLNKALGEDVAKGGSIMKRFFSPQDSGIKNLFQRIKDDYGIDLGQDATIAKFIMDTLGDTRARSLLQLPPRTAMGLVEKIGQRIEEKLTSPEKVIEKARTLTK